MKPWQRSGGVGSPSDQVTGLVLSYDAGTATWSWTWSGNDPPFWQFRVVRAGVFVDVAAVSGVLRSTPGFGPGTYRLAGALLDPSGGVFTTPFSNTVDVF